MSDELVYEVESSRATSLQPISLSEAGLKERQHLQEWVLSNPNILGEGVLILSSEFNEWEAATGPIKDRLDVLALGSDGRLLVAELKRDAAPDTINMQAIGYAAMASRFTTDRLVELLVRFSKSQGTPLSPDQALQKLNDHCLSGLTQESLRAPRIALVACSFSPRTTATAVWLTEMGLDLRLVRLQAYRSKTNVIVTVSQLYPLRDVEEFTIAPSRITLRQEQPAEWTPSEIARLKALELNTTSRCLLELCATRPGDWVPFTEVVASTPRSSAEARGDLAGLTMLLKREFSRKNWPIEADYVGDEKQFSYRMNTELADAWRNAGTSNESA